MDVLIGVDIGGSHVEVNCVLPDGRSLALLEKEVASREVDDVVALALNLIDLVLCKASAGSNQLRVSCIGIGCPGQSKGGVVLAASNFPSWKNVPLVDIVQEKYLDVYVCLLKDSDAALAGELWGEHRSKYGSVRNAVMITLGTGIGVSLLVSGTFYSGTNGLVEGGHMIVDSSPSARICGCGQRGCAETYASASNVVTLFEEKTGDVISAGAAYVFAIADTLGSQSPAPGAMHAESVISKAADVLAILCINICRMTDPEVIIFAGGMSRAGDKLLSRVRERIKVRAWTCLPQTTPLVVASAAHAGSVGAAVVAGKNAAKQARACVAANKIARRCCDLNVIVAFSMSSLVRSYARRILVCGHLFCSSIFP